MNNPTKVGLLAGMMVLAVLTVSGSASATATQSTGGGDAACTGLFPLWDCAFHHGKGVIGLAGEWVYGIRCNYIGGPAC